MRLPNLEKALREKDPHWWTRAYEIGLIVGDNDWSYAEAVPCNDGTLIFRLESRFQDGDPCATVCVAIDRDANCTLASLARAQDLARELFLQEESAALEWDEAFGTQQQRHPSQKLTFAEFVAAQPAEWRAAQREEWLAEQRQDFIELSVERELKKKDYRRLGQQDAYDALREHAARAWDETKRAEVEEAWERAGVEVDGTALRRLYAKELDRRLTRRAIEVAVQAWSAAGISEQLIQRYARGLELGGTL